MEAKKLAKFDLEYQSIAISLVAPNGTRTFLYFFQIFENGEQEIYKNKIVQRK